MRRPDIMLLALRGPLVRVVTPIIGRAPDRPVLVSGFPGLTIPAEPKAIIYREQVDLIVLQSRREVREFRANADELGIPVGFGLTTLPFLSEQGRADVPAAGVDAPSGLERTDLVFAAQAKVPAAREDRVRVLGWLVDAARRRPSRRVVVKVRARRGEAQTHDEAYDFGELLDDPGVRDEFGGSLPPNLVVEDGPMAQHLERAAALVTVSSTAVLEAIARGVPAVVIDEFGVLPRLINTVFEGSGLFGGAEAVTGWDARHPNAEWLDDNYFHGREHDDWQVRVGELLERRAALPCPCANVATTSRAVRCAGPSSASACWARSTARSRDPCRSCSRSRRAGSCARCARCAAVSPASRRRRSSGHVRCLHVRSSTRPEGVGGLSRPGSCAPRRAAGTRQRCA